MSIFTVGPTKMYPAVQPAVIQAFKKGIPSISHRSKEFEEIFIHATSELRKLFNIPLNYKIYFLSSGTEAMERIIQNTVEKYSFHFVNGAFSSRFYETAVELHKHPDKKEVLAGKAFDFPNISIPNKTELVCFTHNETSTGVMLPEKEIEQFKKIYPQKLIAVDVVSSIPYINFDFKYIDLLFFSVQKGLGMPAGLGVLVVSPQAYEKSVALSKKKSTGSYHTFASLEKYAQRNQTPETPNVLNLFLLKEVLKDMNKKGLKAIRKEIKMKSELIVNYVEKKGYELLSADIKNQSPTIHVIKIHSGSAGLINKLKKKGIIVSSGYGDLKEEYIRVANFPAHTMEEVKELLSNL